MRESSVSQADMPLALARRAIALAARAGVMRVRLTGGEPLRHAAFAPLLREIRDAGLEAWVNTAGLPEGGTPWELLGSVAADVLLPLRDRAQRADIADGVRAIRRAGPARVRLGVVLTREHVADLPTIAGLARELGCPLEAYRVMTVPGHVAGSTGDEMRSALAALDEVNRWFPPDGRVRIANAVPFCVTPDLRLAARNCFGARFDDGRSRLVVSPEGEVRPSYALRLALGNLADATLAELWRHPALARLHARERLPAACRSCPGVSTCRGGSRHEALLATGSLEGLDPLAAFPPVAPAAADEAATGGSR
jgi:radical SAM protein with 4Fe4S-binding SPASM domain